MIIDELFEAPQQCPECGGISFSDLILAEKKDACYHKVKASAKVWPSAYASGRLVQCRKKGAANYGNKSEGVAEGWKGALNAIADELGQDAPQLAYELGQEAARNGKDWEDNPYEEGIFGPSEEMEAWHDGWESVKQGVAETRRGQIPMTLKPGETDNLEPEDSEGFKKLPAYKQGQQDQQSRGKDLIQQSPYTYQSDQDWAYRNGAFEARQAATSADFAKRGPLTTAEGEQQKGADYRDPKEVDYDDEYDAMVARVKKLAGLGPMKTVYDPAKRQYRNMPTAVQPKK